ncbi:MAG: hypothetical protein GEV10_06445 [Streptosporangiales bacterium]|nr:hypothetical protein [Streptosporangiales bacterium]
MAIQRGERFPVAFEHAFPKGLVLIGDVEASTEYQSQEDRNRGREAKQRVDERSGKRIWKAVATDPDEGRAKRASFEIQFIADVQPVPPGDEVLPGMRPIALDGLHVEPHVTGQGEYKSLAFRVWATGFADPKAASRSRSQSGQGSQGKEQAA